MCSLKRHVKRCKVAVAGAAWRAASQFNRQHTFQGTNVRLACHTKQSSRSMSADIRIIKVNSAEVAAQANLPSLASNSLSISWSRMAFSLMNPVFTPKVCVPLELGRMYTLTP